LNIVSCERVGLSSLRLSFLIAGSRLSIEPALNTYRGSLSEHRCHSVSQKLIGSLTCPFKDDWLFVQLDPGSSKGQRSREADHRRYTNRHPLGSRRISNSPSLHTGIEVSASFRTSTIYQMGLNENQGTAADTELPSVICGAITDTPGPIAQTEGARSLTPPGSAAFEPTDSESRPSRRLTRSFESAKSIPTPEGRGVSPSRN